MEPTSNFTDQIDAYLLGTMSEQEKATFARLAEQDPLLAQEVRLQQDIISGLQRARIAQLKANLSQIPTPPLSGVGGLSTAQWVGVSVGSLAVVAGGFALFIQLSAPKAPASLSTQAVEVPAPIEVQAHASVDAVPEADKEPHAITSLGAKENNTDENAEQTVNTITPTSTPGVNQGTYKAANLAVDLPLASSKPLTPPQPNEEPEENGELDRPGIGQLPSGKVAEVNEIKSKPEVIIKASDVLSYQYYENKLYLHGSFGDAIYELIELSPTSEGRRLYVYFKDKFYSVNKDVREVTPMKPITDSRLEAELTLLRKKKVE